MLSRVHLAIHARIQDFSSGGGGGAGQSDKKSPDNVFLVLSLFHFSRFQRGSNIFQGGGPTLSRGSNCLYPIETHITCDFPEGSGPPDPPLDPHLLS